MNESLIEPSVSISASVVEQKNVLRQHPQFKIVDSFYPERLFGVRIFDFIWQIFPRQYHILDNWAKFFRERDEPHLITSESRGCWDCGHKTTARVLRLWKRLECGEHHFYEFDEEMMKRWSE